MFYICLCYLLTVAFCDFSLINFDLVIVYEMPYWTSYNIRD